MSFPASSLEYTPLTIRDRLPAGLDHGSVDVQSTIMDRRRVRQTPQGTTGFTGSLAAGYINTQSLSQVNFLLASGSDYVDPESFTLNCQFSYQWANNYNLPDDFPVLSWIDRARLYIGGVLVEDVAFASRKAVSEVYASAPQEVYKTTMSATCGAYKFNPDLYGSGASPASLLKNQPAARQATVAGSASTPEYYDLQIPLSLLFGVMRLKKFLPLRNLGQVQVTIDWNPAIYNNCFIISNTASTGSWAIQNMELNYDAMSVSPMYAAIMDSICASPGGLRLPFETCQVLLTQYSGAGQKSLVFSKQVKSLSHMLIVRQDTSNQALPTWPKISTFEKIGLNTNYTTQTNAYVQIGSQRFPQDPKSVGGLYYMMLDANGLANSPFSVIADFENYAAAGQTSASALDTQAQCQILGFSFEKTRNEDLMSSGLDTGAQNIVLYLQDVPSNTTNCYGMVYFKNLLHVAGNMVRVEQDI